MKAKDLTQDDVGKWVVLRAEVVSKDHGPAHIQILFDTILEFTNPPPPEVPEVGDVFKNLGGNHPAEWAISMIDGDACIMRYLTGHVSADYPLNPDLWEFVRKGTTK